jgi:cellulose synthase/poly-beta-1,6-N-acetylglucosamine synthase-like glycosyltransferase
VHVGILGAALIVGYVVLVLLLSVAALFGYRMFKPLARLAGGGGHRVSIIVAAKQEADTLRESLASLVELEHADKEVIVVCGPSSDGTEEVAREFAGRVTVLKEPERPADWIGKSWACHNGYLRSTGDVLLFADGDVLHSKESLDTVLANLDAEKADLLSLWPEIVTRAKSERVIFPASLFFLCAGVAATSTRRTPKGRSVDGANGQYIMVRREAYEKIGGHSAIRSEIMEDGAMGRRAGLKGLEVVNSDGDGYVKVMPYSRFGEAWEAHERFGAGLVPSWGALVGACVLTLTYFVGPFALLGAGLAASSGALVVAGAFTCATAYAMDALFTLKSSRLAYFLLAPLSGLLVTAAFATGFVRFRRGGITWKGVKYGRDRFKPL